jgi:hypothetical protein
MYFAGHTDPDPRKKRATLDDIQPTLDEIVMNIRALSEPGTSFYIRHSDDALHLADSIQNHMPSCCAYHKVDQLAVIQIEITNVLARCESAGCPHTDTHDFHRGIIDSINKPMNRLMKKLTLESMLHERTN